MSVFTARDVPFHCFVITVSPKILLQDVAGVSSNIVLFIMHCIIRNWRYEIVIHKRSFVMLPYNIYVRNTL